jgi:hypothetical protein
VKIERKTTDGWLALDDEQIPETVKRCASHGDDQPDEPDQLIGLSVVTGQGRKLETAICPDCIVRALALYFGRNHVAAGGSVSDLSDESAVDDG